MLSSPARVLQKGRHCAEENKTFLPAPKEHKVKLIQVEIQLPTNPSLTEAVEPEWLAGPSVSAWQTHPSDLQSASRTVDSKGQMLDLRGTAAAETRGKEQPISAGQQALDYQSQVILLQYTFCKLFQLRLLTLCCKEFISKVRIR